MADRRPVAAWWSAHLSWGRLIAACSYLEGKDDGYIHKFESLHSCERGVYWLSMARRWLREEESIP